MDFGLTSSLTYVCMEFGGLLYSEEEYFIVVVDCDWLADVIVDKLYYMKHFWVKFVKSLVNFLEVLVQVSNVW